ncbi:DUF927 domain-containing protein [Thiocystis violascens]|uniref:DNA/RNA helicase, superfamily II n=1 Tax=Thiocystis violascens (strain ATCC 17096 / DSM 198 / 6111) TaxID=765911 RepID=I3Y976_THIV6|nr:DUF927 domain-containing protein [Thiocystis violascens]AFL73544.1 DNA/RNA helicase, superfamily II [Thiocystis violascens DSM 198]
MSQNRKLKPRRGIRIKAIPETVQADLVPMVDSETPESDATPVNDATALNQEPKTGSVGESPDTLPTRPADILDGAINPATDPPGEDETLVECPPIATECPCWRVYLDWWQAGQDKRRPGVYYHGRDKNELGEAVRTDEWLCGPLILEATTFDRRNESFGRLLRFRDVRGNWHEWNMPMHLLRGSCEELRGELLDLGLEINPNSRGKLANYLLHKAPKREVTAALSLGWHDDTFVLPDVSIGTEAIRFQSETATVADFDQRGTLLDWQTQVCALARGNTSLTLAISAALAGPLLARVHVESCGLHLYGESSGGKTTALQAAVSVWGSRDLLRTWRGTGNGLEAAAAESTDTLLALDEINEADGKEIGSIVYALANGRGKSRANRSGGARRIARWRTVVLSSGEKTLEARMLESGARHHAGQDVRLLNLPADGRRYGTFDEIHGRDSARAFADEIKTASARCYGTAGRAFVQFLVAHLSEDYGAMVKALTDRMPTLEGQEARAARQFALIGTAGELATQAGITGWEPGAATKAATDAFLVWRDARGSGNAEASKILDAIRDFIERYGDTRFTAVDDRDGRLLRGERAGYTKVIEGRLAYLLTPGGLGEAIKGFDRKRALDVLASAGWLLGKAGSKGERRLQCKIDGRNVGLYAICLPDDEQDGDDATDKRREAA